MALPPASSDPAGKAEQQRAAQQDVFLREVDDALRHDQLEGFMRNWGKLVLGVTVGGLALFAAYLGWDHWQGEENAKDSEQLVLALDALDTSNLGSARDKLAPLAGDKGTVAAMAKITQGGMAQRQNKPADAVRLFGEVAKDESLPQPIRDLALVREVAAGFDTMPPAQVVERLKPLAVPGNAWFGVAGEMTAMAFLKQGQKDRAGALLVAIARDKDQPESLRSRTQQLAGTLGYDALAKVVDARGQPVTDARIVTAATAPAAP